MPTINELRQQYPGYADLRDEDIINDMAAANNVGSDVMAAFLGWERPTFGKEAVRAVKRTAGSLVGGVGEMYGDVSGNRDNALARYGHDVEQANPSGINSLRDVADYPMAAVGNALGNAGMMILPGAGLKIAGNVARGAKMLNTARALDNPLTQAAVAGMPSLSEIGESQRESGLPENYALKYLGAGAVGAIENLGGVQRMMGLGRAPQVLSKADEVAQFGATPWRTMGKTMLRSGLEEGLEEIPQTFIEKGAGYQDPFSAKNLEEAALGGVLGAIGGGVLGAGHGASRGLRHAQVNRERSLDLLNPETPLGRLNDQAEWERAFIAKERGQAAADMYYNGQQSTIDNYIEGLVEPYRRQVFSDEMNAIQQRADQERIAARAPSQMQVPGYDPRDEMVGNMIERGPVREQQQWWENVPDPTNPAAYQQFWQHVTAGQDSMRPQPVDALGYPLAQYQPAPAVQTQPAAPSWAQFGVEPSPVPQGTPSATQTQPVAAQAAATTQQKAQPKPAAAPAAKVTQPRGQFSQAFQARLEAAVAEGKVAPDDPIVADWHASKKLKADAQSFGLRLNEIEAGPDNMPLTAEQSLQAKAKNAVAEVKDGGLNLTMKQIPVFNHLQKAFAENRVDDVIGADGKWKYNEIGTALGLARGSVESFVNGVAKRIAEAQGVSVDEMKAALKARTAEVRTTEMSEKDKLGLSPKQQSSVFNEEDLFGNENGAEQNAEVINTVGGSQSAVGTNEAPTDIVVSRPDAPEVVANRAQATDRAMQEMLGELRGISEARRKEAMDTWNEYAESSDPVGVPFHEVPTNRQFTWALALNDFLDEYVDLPPKEFGEKLLDLYHEYSNDLGTLNGTQQSASIAESGAGAPQIGNPGTESQSPRLEGPRKETAVENRAVPEGQPVTEQAAGRSDTEGQAVGVESKPKFSVGDQGENNLRGSLPGADSGSGSGKAGSAGKNTADGVRNKLRKLFFSGSKFDSLVRVVQTRDDLKQYGIDVAKIPANAHGFVQGGKVYMIAGNIQQGQELAKFLHEVGVHLGMGKLVGSANVEYLGIQISRWADAAGKGTNIELAKKAMARVANAEAVLGKQGQKMNDAETMEELVAYFVEEAVQAGINPQAVSKVEGPLAKWFRTLWAAAKVALRKIGMYNFEQMTPQNFVDLAYGAARMELEGTWHGTAADFRNFNHDYMGSGEGAQAFGWGTYLAQRTGIAKGYWKDDISRKTKGGRFETASGYPITEGELVRELTNLVKNDPDFDLDTLKVIQRNWSETLAKWSGRPEFYHEANKLQYALTELEDAIADGGITYLPRTQPEGSLMRVDTAVHDDELLDWDKPLSEQPVILEKLQNMGYEEAPSYAIAGKYKYHADSTGAEFYKLLENDRGSDKAASLYLDSIGIKGIKFLDSQSRGNAKSYDTYPRAYALNDAIAADDMLGFDSRAEVRTMLKKDGLEVAQKNYDMSPDLVKEAKAWLDWLATPVQETRNLVIFNDKNIQRVSTQVGARKDSASIKFSIAATERIQEVAGPTAARLSTDASTIIGRAAKWFMSLHDLIGKYGNMLPSANDWYKSVRATIATRTQLEGDAESIAARAGKLKPKVLEALNKFVADSTFEQKWGFDATFDKIDGTKRSVTADPEMARRFNDLPEDARQIAKDMFLHAEAVKLTKFKLLKELGLSGLFDTQGSLQGPYAPLKRFGNYVAVLKSKELLAAEYAGDKKRVEELKRDYKHYVVSYFDTKGLAKEFAQKEQAKSGWAYAQPFPKAQHIKETSETSQATLQKVLAAMKVEKDKLPPGAYAMIEEVILDMHMRKFDEDNARMNGLKRKNRYGYDEDMVRAFLSHARAEAGFLANLKHGGKTNELFYKMQFEAGKAKDRDAAMEVFNAISNHYAANIDQRETPIQDRITALTSVMQLATNPAYHLQNLTQPFITSVPRLAADFGDYSGAWKALMDGYRVVRSVGTKNIDLSKVQNLKLRAALQGASDAGLLDVGMDEDLINFEATRTGYAALDVASKGAKKVIHMLRQVSRRVEGANRISAAVAAFNMAQASGKFKDDAAINDYVISVLQDTQGDFSRTDAPLIIKKLPKPLVQYRKFQLMMAAHYVKAFNDAFRSESPEARAVGRRALAYSLGHAFATAGALGIPLMNIVGLIFAHTGDDDEPRDLERSLREWIGDEDMAKLLLHGPLWWMGMDAKLAQDKVFSFLPYADWDLTSKEGLKNLGVGLAGPAGSQTLKMVGGLEYLSKGDTIKGFEGLLPSGISNGLKAFRIANEGFTLKNGDLMMSPDEINGAALMLDAVGLKSPTMRDLEWTRNQQYEIKEFYQTKTKEIQRAYADAYKNGDTDAMTEAREEWMALQEGKDRLRAVFNNSPDELKRQPLSTLLKYPRAQDKREQKLQKSVPE